MVRTQDWDAGTHINWNFLFNVLGQHIGCADLKIAKKSDKGVRQHPDHGRKLLLCIVITFFVDFYCIVSHQSLYR